MIKQGDIINIQFDGECNDYGDFIYNYSCIFSNL